MKTLERTLVILTIVLLMVFSFFAGLYSGQGNARSIASLAKVNLGVGLRRSEKESMNLIKEVFGYLRDRYLYEIEDPTGITDAAIGGMLTGLREAPFQDPYSYYLPPQSYKVFNYETEGTYKGGIGILIGQAPDEIYPTIMTVFEDTPAEKVGLKELDRVIDVDGRSTAGMDTKGVSDLIIGRVGTTVKVTVERGDEGKRLTFEIERAKIIIKTVTGVKVLSGGIGYVRITNFNERTDEELQERLKDFEKRELRGLIIDLRNNPGGIFESAVGVSDLFLKEGRIVSVEGRVYKKEEWDANASTYKFNGPVCILVNRFSASAAEILAAALKENGRAILIGEKTYGKGSVQEVFDLSNKGAVALTIAHYKTPEGHDLSKGGIEPTIKVGMEEIEAFEPKAKVLREKLDDLRAETKLVTGKLRSVYEKSDLSLIRGEEEIRKELQGKPRKIEVTDEKEKEVAGKK